MSTFRNRQRPVNAYDLLPPERPKPRLTVDRLQRSEDVEDADFVVIADAPRAARPASVAKPFIWRPQNDNGHAQQARPVFARKAANASSSDVLARSERLLRRLSENMFSALVALVFVVVFAVAGGISALASSGNEVVVSEPVEITHVTVTPKTLNGMPVLLVNGVIENHGAVTLSSPRLRADVYSGNTLVSSTLFRTLTAEIGTGESRGFQVKLPQAGGKAPDIRIALAE